MITRRECGVRAVVATALCLLASPAVAFDGLDPTAPSPAHEGTAHEGSGYEGRFSTEELRAGMPVIGPVPGVTATWVTREATRNGLPLQIRQLESTRPLREVVESYKRRFTDLGMLAPHEDSGSDFAQLYGGLGPYFVRLHVAHRDGRTTGYLSVIAQPGTVRAVRASEFPLPASVEIVSRTAYGDDGDEAETLMGESRELPGVLVDDFLAGMAEDGWSRTATADSERNTASMRGRANLTYRRGDELAQIVIAGREQGFPRRSIVMVHWLKGQ